MTTRQWIGQTGDWYTIADWNTFSPGAAGYPQAGDILLILSGTVELFGSEATSLDAYDSVGIALGSTTNSAELDLVDAVTGRNVYIGADNAILMATGVSEFTGTLSSSYSNATVTFGSAANGSQGGDLVVEFANIDLTNGATLAYSGTVTLENDAYTLGANDPLVNNGTVNAIGSTQTIQSAITGAGTFNLEFQTTLFTQSSVAATETVNFGDVDGRLKIADLPDFAATITNFSPGNLIDLTTLSGSNAVYDPTHQTITVNNGPGTTPVAVIENVQALPGTLFATSDGGSGTLISYANAATSLQYDVSASADALGANVVHTMTVPGTSALITGAGVKIGIISDSFDEVSPGSANAEAAGGYLPQNGHGGSAVTVLQEGPSGSGDEGRAMAELIYQVAPGAQLYFASGAPDQTAFANAVNDLVAAGVNIIVDDLSFTDSPQYQVDGVVDAAVSNAIADGVNYFTSGGNFGADYLQQNFTPAEATLYDGTQARAEVFSNGTPYLAIQTTTSGTARALLSLSWTAPFEGTSNTGAPTALILKAFDASGNLVGTSTQDVDGNGLPEANTSLFLPSAAATYQIAIYLADGAAAPSGFKLMVDGLGSGSGPGGFIEDPNAAIGTGDVFGQSLVPGVNTVGATFYGNSAAFAQQPDFTEYFSSVGPGQILYDSNGNLLATPQSAGKVDIVAPDGSATAVPGFNPFFGTSAAAPNAAAVAALMLQANPALTTTQVSNLLAQSAVSLGLPSAEQGAGLVQADAAVIAAEESACYCPGTRILTDRGEIPIECLAIGDNVITASGQARPIRWIGRRSYGARLVRRSQQLWPVVFRAGSLGDGVPARDLAVSRRHAMYFVGVLVPAEVLVNGVTIVQTQPAAEVQYHHLELDSHDMILANGAPSESFVDDDSRAMFHNAHEYHALYPSAERRPACYGAPRLTEGAAVAGIRQRLAVRAGLCQPPVAAPLRGFVDEIHPSRVVGWAQNPAQPEMPVCLDIVSGGVIIVQTLANRRRADLAAAGLGSGRHSFLARLPGTLTPQQRSALVVRRSSDNAPLPRSVRALRAA